MLSLAPKSLGLPPLPPRSASGLPAFPPPLPPLPSSINDPNLRSAAAAAEEEEEEEVVDGGLIRLHLPLLLPTAEILPTRRL